VLTLTPPSNVTALASGTPLYYRITSAPAFVLTQAAISGSVVTYTGTITGGGSNAFLNAQINVSGFVNAGNNNTFVVTASTATTLVVTNASGVNETHAGSAAIDTGTAVVLQGSAGVSTGDLSFASTIASGGTAGITSYTLTEGDV
jgi:hypothetical protein